MTGGVDHGTIAPAPVAAGRAVRRIALVGNPNVGKTTLFNRLCGLRSKTANFPGSTVEAHTGQWRVERGEPVEVVDLPGVYALDLALPESALCRDCLSGRVQGCEPDALVVVLDATNLARNLQFLQSVGKATGESADAGRPMVVAITMADIAARKGLSIDARLVAEHIGCPAVIVSGRTGEGLDDLEAALPSARPFRANRRDGESASAWASRVVEESVGGARAAGTDHDTVADRLDAAFTHPVLGSVIFAALMAGLFLTIFTLAGFPMDAIEMLFGVVGGAAKAWLGEGILGSLVADGIVGGLAGTIVFLPQICLLFFLLSLLEDTGYLARAAFVMDRVMCRFGLPGQAFVPLLSSHACALPGIMSARLIPDRRDRIATILVAPFMSCSARLPVYVLLTTVLFGDRPWLAGLAFAGCYVLGAVAALISAAIFRSTILRGASRPMVLELPSYKMPSIRTALLVTYDRAKTFLVNAGTIIMAICIVMWWLSAFPQAGPTAEATALRAQAESIVAAADGAAEREAEAESLVVEADRLDAEAQQAHSFAGRIGDAVQPLFAPLGFDRQLTVATLTAFLAREVFVSTLAVLQHTDEEDEAMLEKLASATREDGSTLLTPATSAGLLVFFVLAMQCLPTLAVTKRETGSWGWAGLQFVWMSGLAYVLALITVVSLNAAGIS